ncbi:hypothetical protein M569_16390 [Genlisea aurea]|uniref:Uncharacterized protein n=1 Tax=Genlisea aurea TaxID=192259 RepID=S8BV30_9LAMI|nr:hypothetical protein M569_16390 [Genlisea aurea]
MKGGDFESESDEADRCLSFRLCMANVLIVACQRIPDSGKKLFVKMITPRVVQSFQATEEAEIKAACVQILLSVAYHLKSYILLQSNELVDVALKCLRHGSVKEKMGGVKLVGCLMAGEEEVVDNISSGLMQARACLQDLLLSSDFDCEPDLRRICQQLLYKEEGPQSARNRMLQLFFTLAFSAAPLILYIPPPRNLNFFVETVESILRDVVSSASILQNRIGAAISRLLSVRLAAAA